MAVLASEIEAQNWQFSEPGFHVVKKYGDDTDEVVIHPPYLLVLEAKGLRFNSDYGPAEPTQSEEKILWQEQRCFESPSAVA